MTRTQAETCPTCTAALRADRAAGLIYGPYAIETTAGREHVDSYVFAACTGACTYCQALLPRHRRRYLLRFIPSRLILAVIGTW